MDTKSLARIEIKDADKGEVTAVFSTYDVKDSDGDVTLPGAFEDGQEVIISAFGHTSWGGRLPVGKGVIRTTKTEAILDGSFFLDTVDGADTFKTVKNLGPLGQWSYGFDVTKESFGDHQGERVRFLEGLKAHEVSPVLLGAGVNTRTLSAKSKSTFADEGEAVLAALSAFGVRAADVMAMRREKGKGLSPESAGLVERIEAELKRLGVVLAQEPEPPIEDDVTREWLRDLARRIA
ncbi:MAG: HK97 family phage prohead protease [Streptosporangiaceae bacterium]